MARRKKTDDEPKENQENINNESDETFGLPEVEYEPLKRDQEEPPAEVPAEPIEEPVNTPVEEEPVYERPYEEETPPPVYREETTAQENHEYASSYHYVEERSSPWPKIAAVGIIVVLALGALYYFLIYQPNQKEKARQELAERTAAEQEAARKRREQQAEEARQQAEQRRLDSLAAVPKEGSIEMLSSRTGQYYIVVASAIDDDLLTDFANKLVKEGKNVKIIPPFGKNTKFYRLAIDAKDNYTDAQATADGMKGGDFGDQLWVVRY